MKLSVVIPTSNRLTILETVKSIVGNTLLPEEIVIIDQGTLNIQDRVKNIIPDSIKFTYHRDKGSGAARARNLGWQLAAGDLIAFTDDDAIVSSGWIKGITDSFAELQGIGLVSGKIIPDYKEKNKEWTLAPQWEYILPSYDQGNKTENYSPGAYPPSVNIAIPKKILELVNGFNEKLGTNTGNKGYLLGEDCELAINVSKANYRVIYNPEVMVYHPVPLSRQNIEFLRKRMFASGYTKAYIDNYKHHFSFTQKIFIVYDMIRKTIKLFLIKKSLSIQDFEVEKNRSFGYMLSMFHLLKTNKEPS